MHNMAKMFAIVVHCTCNIGLKILKVEPSNERKELMPAGAHNREREREQLSCTHVTSIFIDQIIFRTIVRNLRISLSPTNQSIKFTGLAHGICAF